MINRLTAVAGSAIAELHQPRSTQCVPDSLSIAITLVPQRPPSLAVTEPRLVIARDLTADVVVRRGELAMQGQQDEGLLTDPALFAQAEAGVRCHGRPSAGGSAFAELPWT
ncbi:hypothetical protein [Nonomuraea sp. NPDC003214]